MVMSEWFGGKNWKYHLL